MDRLIDIEKAQELRRYIDDSRHVVLTCHVRPDGDAIGSTLGLKYLLESLGKTAHVIVPDKPPFSLSFLPGFKEIGVYTSHPDYCKKTIGEADLIICCDFNQPSRQDMLSPVVQNAHCRKVLIDHHREPSRFTDLIISYPDMSSTCELVLRLIAAMGLFNNINLDCATCLLTGMITDTRNFTVNIKHSDIYDIMMRLLEIGADKEKIIREALNKRSYNSLKLESYALAEKLKVYWEHCAAIITLTKEELVKYDYQPGDTEGLVNRPLEIRGIIYSFYFREDPDCIKVSARSTDEFPVSEICKNLYNGGGHLQAAGGEFKGSLAEAVKILENHLNEYDSLLPKNKKG